LPDGDPDGLAPHRRALHRNRRGYRKAKAAPT